MSLPNQQLWLVQKWKNYIQPSLVGKTLVLGEETFGALGDRERAGEKQLLELLS